MRAATGAGRQNNFALMVLFGNACHSGQAIRNAPCRIYDYVARRLPPDIDLREGSSPPPEFPTGAWLWGPKETLYPK